MGRGLRLGKTPTLYALIRKRDDLARLDLADKRRPDRVQCHRLTGHARRARFGLPQHQRTPAPRITRRLDPVIEQKHQRIRPLQVRQHLRQRVFLGKVMRRQQHQDHLGIRRGLEHVPAGFVFPPQQVGVDQVCRCEPAPPARRRIHAAKAGRYSCGWTRSSNNGCARSPPVRSDWIISGRRRPRRRVPCPCGR